MSQNTMWNKENKIDFDFAGNISSRSALGPFPKQRAGVEFVSAPGPKLLKGPRAAQGPRARLSAKSGAGSRAASLGPDESRRSWNYAQCSVSMRLKPDDYQQHECGEVWKMSMGSPTE